jgi:transcriptional regulator with XRE-family HTH domain
MAKGRDPLAGAVGNILARIRQRRQLTRPDMGAALGFEGDTREHIGHQYGEYECGQRMLTLALLQNVHAVFFRHPEDAEALDEWEQLMRHLALLPGGWDPPETEFQLLDGEARTRDWPPLIRALYAQHHAREEPPPWARPPVPDPLARIARFGADGPGRLVVGVDPGRRQRRSTPDYDTLAAQAVRAGLRERAVGLDILSVGHAEPAPARADGDLVVVGGPGSHRLSEAINQALATRAMGVRGFFFAPAGEAPGRAGDLIRCWRLKAHDLPDDPGIPDPEDPYARLPDGRKEDVGIVYVGANPLALPHWLIWVAGLGAVGTVGAARALQEPRVVERIARGLTDRQTYCCALIRYRFADEQRPLDGALASVALTRGVLRQPVGGGSR